MINKEERNIHTSLLKAAAMILGLILIVVGILGFVPEVKKDDLLLGLFRVDPLHNGVHIVTGLAGLIAGLTSRYASRLFFQIFGIIYAVLAILGFYYHNRDILDIVTNNMADAWLHTAIAVVFLYFGFAHKEDHIIHDHSNHPNPPNQYNP